MHKRIAITFPTNVGDVILALPLLDRLKANFPSSKITAVASPQTKDFLIRNNYIDNVEIFDKRWNLLHQGRFAFSLFGKFDIFVDLKNTLMPFIAAAKIRSPIVRRYEKNLHIRKKYLSLIDKFTSDKELTNSSFPLNSEEKEYLKRLNLRKSIFIACSSRSRIKCYDKDCLRKVIELLRADYSVVIVGDEKDREYYGDILMQGGVTNLVGKTRSMIEVAYLLKNYALALLGVDSSILHLGSYLNIPIIAFFGPTHPDRSYPYSDKSVVLQNPDVNCSPCEKPGCEINIECMKVDPNLVVDSIKKLIGKENNQA